MKDHSIKLTLANALLLCCLQIIITGMALAGINSVGQQGAPAGKRKSLHEYGPEDLHPEAQENETSARRKPQTPAPRARNLAPSSPRSRDALTPAATPAPAPELGAAPSVISEATPAPTPSSRPAGAGTAMTPSSSQKVKDSEGHRRKLIISSSIFVLLFLALIFFAIKMWRQLRAEAQVVKEKSSPEQLPATKLRIVGQGESEKRANRSGIKTKTKTKTMKTEAQNKRGARFKKA